MFEFLKPIRFKYRLTLAVAKKHWPILVFGLLFGLSAFFWEPKLEKWLATLKIERVGVVGKYRLDNLPDDILRKISRGLTKINAQGEVEGDLASNWEIKQDGREYLFTLKDDLYWNDGKAVKAEDIVYNLSDVTSEAVGDKQIKFLLRESYSPFPSVVAKPVFKGKLVGIGDYQLKRFRLNGQIVAEINIESKNELKTKIIYRFYPTDNTAKIAFKLGEVERLENLEDLGDLKDWNNLKKEASWPSDQIVSLIFNTQEPMLASKPVRQALAYAIKKDWGNRAVSSISLKSWAFNSNVKPYHFDLENARELLKKGTEIKEIELQTAPLLIETAEAIKKDWQEIGIETKIKAIDSLSNNFQAMLIVQEIPDDPDQYVLWHSTQPANISRLKNPKIDKLLEDGRKLVNQEERKAVYQDLQRFLAEEVPAVFLYYPTLYTVSRH